jgi:hypothetical protein
MIRIRTLFPPFDYLYAGNSSASFSYMMKIKHILLVTSLCFTIPALSQLPDYIFNHRDDVFPGNYDSGIKTYSWNHGVLILGFSVDTLNEDYGMTLVFYDSLGSRVWMRNFRISGFTAHNVLQGNDIAFDNNDFFYVTGVLYQSPALGWDMFFAKFDQNGDSLFFRSFPDTISKFPVSMTFLSSDTILVLSAWQHDMNNGPVRICIDRVDTNGRIRSTYLGDPAPKDPYQILKTEGNQIYVGGTQQVSAIGGGYNVRVFINRYDLDLNYLGTINPSLTVNEYFISLMNHKGRVYLSSLISAAVPPYPYLGWVGCLSKIFINGTWATRNFGVPQIEEVGVYNAIAIDDNRLAVPIADEGHFYLYFCDTNFIQICSTYVSYPGKMTHYGLSAICGMPGHQIAGTGFIFDDVTGAQDHWNFLTQDMVAFIDSNCVETGIPPVQEEKGSVRIYPNPMDDHLFITTNNPVFTDAIVTIYNQVGTVVSRLMLKDNPVIATSGFNPGIYLVKIQSGEATEVMKVIKVTH